MPIPARLIRTVPRITTDETERFWHDAMALHPGWEHVSLRDPVDRSGFPVTRHLWDSCETGAQLADLIRTEELWQRGGVYLDSDVDVFRPLDPLLGVDGFAGWEDTEHIPNAVMGFTPAHPALAEVLSGAIRHHDDGTWAAGVGVTTAVFAGRDDMLLLPPGSFYPVPWQQAHRAPIDTDRVRAANPWAYALHHYKGSWVR